MNEPNKVGPSLAVASSKPVPLAPAEGSSPTSKPAASEASRSSGEGTPKAAPTQAARLKRAGVGLDMSGEDVIHLDEEGYLLSFDPDPGQFVELGEETVRGLSFENRVAYGVAQALWKKLSKEQAGPRSSGIEVLPPMAASATRRLEVSGRDDARWHYCWKRPDELHSAGLEGYTMAGDEVDTFAGKVGTTHTIGAFGRPECYLMRIPKEKFEAIERAAGEESRRRIDAQADSAKEKIREQGGVPFDPEAKKDLNWREGEGG